MKKRNTKKKITIIDKIETCGIILGAAALICWGAWSAYETLKPEEKTTTYEIDTSSVSNYINSLSEETNNTEKSDKDTKTEENVEVSNNENVDKETEIANDTNVNEIEDSNNKENKEAETDKAETVAPTSTPEPTPTSTPAPTATQTSEPTPETEATEPPATTKKYTAAYSIYIRSQASTSSAAMGGYAVGDTIDVTEDGGEWLKIKKGDVEGYVKAEYVTVEEVPVNEE